MKKMMMIVMVMILALPILAVAQKKSEAGKDVSIMERIQKATELIKASQEAREAGIPDEEVTEALEGARKRGLSPRETEEIMSESTAAVEESGPVDNFGAFVQAKLDEGLRGQELASAIHEEHRKHGKGKGHGKNKGKKEKGGSHGKGHGDQHHGDDDHDHEDDDDDHGDDDDDEKVPSRKKGKAKNK